MLSERIFSFGNLLAKLALVSWVGNVPGFYVLSEVGFPAALIRTVKTKPELSILVHFTLYFSFNIYKQQSLLKFMQTMFSDVMPPSVLSFKSLVTVFTEVP